ncbi:MAG: pseudouridine synthase [Acidobacteria bacterium]|nr:pseudouridine synthase [Acidobacteriota bacterium]
MARSYRSLAFHKPFNVLSQFTPEPGSAARTLKEFIPVEGVYAVGRLDRDSEGLLLLTDDGALQHRLTDPRFGHPRTYWAEVEGIPGREALRALEAGVALDGYRTRPAAVRLLAPAPDVPPRDPPVRFRKLIPTAWIELTLTEGRNRQVRRMSAAVGFPTLRLIRVAIGPLQIAGLAPGSWRMLTSEELRLVTK